MNSALMLLMENKYGMGLRKDMFKTNKDYIPGPGQYKSEVVDLKRNAQSYRWGKDTRFGSTGKSRKESPGPGMYSTKGTFGGPKYGFGSGQRPQNNTKGVLMSDQSPGPGI